MEYGVSSIEYGTKQAVSGWALNETGDRLIGCGLEGGARLRRVRGRTEIGMDDDLAWRDARALANGGHGNDRPTLKTRRASLRTPFSTQLYSILGTLYSGYSYWQDSQMPPLRMASMEHAFFSSAV